MPEPGGAGLGRGNGPAAAAVALAGLTTISDWIASALPPASSVPPQHPARTDQQPEPTDSRARQPHEQCREERPILRPQSWPPVTELSLQDGELMAQNEDLNVVLAVRHQQ